MAGGRQIRLAVPLVLQTCAGDQPTENVAEEAAGEAQHKRQEGSDEAYPN
jgi:hypothetical protein